MRQWGVTDAASGPQQGSSSPTRRGGTGSSLGTRERPEPERGLGAGRRVLKGGVASEPICRPAPGVPVTSCRRPRCGQMSRLSDGTAVRPAAERARALTPATDATPAPGTDWEQQGTKWRERGRRGATSLLHCRDRKTEARERGPGRVQSRPLPRTTAPRKRVAQNYFLTEGGRRPSPRKGKWILRMGGKEGLSADRRLVIFKKFISTFKKREPEGPGCPGTEARGGSWGSGWVGKPPLPLPAPPGTGEGTGHRLTDSRTRSRAHGSRINNFIYTLHTVCTVLLLPGRSERGLHTPLRLSGCGERAGCTTGAWWGVQHRGRPHLFPGRGKGGAWGSRRGGGSICTSGGGSGSLME